MWRRGVVVITTSQLPSAKPELRFCACSNQLAECQRFAMMRISDVFRRSTCPQKQFIIINIKISKSYIKLQFKVTSFSVLC